MLVTRTEMFTDWSYEGAHMGEQAATVGRGLMSGHIYFRYAYDFLDTGERVQRERSFVELSDGSTYELGSGESAEKITIIDDGITSGGEVHLEVRGKPSIGVGVSRILRHVTIEYDDGKVPVLDTDQLNGVLKQLSDSLTESMVSTAEAVKDELRTELSSKLADVQVNLQNQCNETVNRSAEALREEIDESAQGIQEDLSDWVESAGSTHDNLQRQFTELHENVDKMVYVAQYPIGRFTNQAANRRIPILTNMNTLEGHDADDAFEVVGDGEDVCLRISNGIDPLHNRILNLTYSPSYFDLVDGSNNGYMYLIAATKDGTLFTQSALFVNQEHRWQRRTPYLQMSLSYVIPRGMNPNNILTDGFKLFFLNAGRSAVTLEPGTLGISLIRS